MTTFNFERLFPSLSCHWSSFKRPSTKTEEPKATEAHEVSEETAEEKPAEETAEA